MVKLEELIQDIKNDRISGAREIATKTLKSIKMAVNEIKDVDNFLNFINNLKRIRPTFLPIANICRIVEKWIREGTDFEDLKRHLGSLENYFKKSVNMLVDNALETIFQRKRTVFTISRSSTVISVLRAAKEAGYLNQVYVMESKPLSEGISLAKFLISLGVNTKLVTDSAIAFYMNDVDKVIVGADAIIKKGFVNKIGTRVLASVSKLEKKDFYVLSDTFKIDLERDNYKNEYIVLNEIFKDYELDGLGTIKLPLFELTPHNLVSAYITEVGIASFSELEKIIVKRNKLIREFLPS